MDDTAWRALGAAIGEARAAHEAEAPRRVAARWIGQLEILLWERDGARELLHPLAAELAALSLDDWNRAGGEAEAEELAMRDVWRALDDTWHWTDSEGGADEGLALFRRGLADEDLGPLRAEMLAALERLEPARAAVAEHDLLGTWPLEHVGGARELHAQAIAQIRERTGIPESDMLSPDAIEDLPCFLLADDAQPIEDLHAALTRRAAWARALHSLARSVELGSLHH